MGLSFGPQQSRQEVFNKVGVYLGSLSIEVASVDSDRPWGGFYVIDGSSTDRFIETYFPDYDPEQIKQFGTKLGLKILLVAPHQNLSWQYHSRRAELWRGVAGPSGFRRSKTDEQGALQTLADGQIVQFGPRERHRLVGLDNWGVVAEIWQHTDPNQPSTEDDIVRLEDQYGR